jgi:NAD(P)-dependent dehydrogenase (short-subunit alcohol dehydrogenase family)
MSEPLLLAGEIAIVTGAGGDIGWASCVASAKVD